MLLLSMTMSTLLAPKLAIFPMFFTNFLSHCCVLYWSLLLLLYQHGDPNYSNKNHHWPEWRRRHVVRVKQLYSLEQQSNDDQTSSSSTTTETCYSSDTATSKKLDQSCDSAVDGFINDADTIGAETDNSNHHSSTTKTKIMQSSYPGMYKQTQHDTYMSPNELLLKNCAFISIERVCMHVIVTCVHFTPFYLQSTSRSSMNPKCN
jgi:hypothetical protein